MFTQRGGHEISLLFDHQEQYNVLEVGSEGVETSRRVGSGKQRHPRAGAAAEPREESRPVPEVQSVTQRQTQVGRREGRPSTLLPTSPRAPDGLSSWFGGYLVDADLRADLPACVTSPLRPPSSPQNGQHCLPLGAATRSVSGCRAPAKCPTVGVGATGRHVASSSIGIHRVGRPGPWPHAAFLPAKGKLTSPLLLSSQVFCALLPSLWNGVNNTIWHGGVRRREQLGIQCTLKMDELARRGGIYYL